MCNFAYKPGEQTDASPYSTKPSTDTYPGTLPVNNLQPVQRLSRHLNYKACNPIHAMPMPVRTAINIHISLER